MPYVIDPSTPPPTKPTLVTSPDGFLTATLDPGNAGVQLFADFNEKVTATNLLPHPVWGYDDSPVVSASGTNWWSYANAGATYTLGPGDVYGGRTSVRFTATGTTSGNARLGIRNRNLSVDGMGIPAGTDFWFAADAYLSASALSESGLGVNVIFRDDVAGDSSAATIDLAHVQNQLAGRDVWTRLWWRATVNAGRTITGIYTHIIGSAPQPDGAFLQVGRWMAVAARPGETAPPDYFDGDTPPDDTYSYRWSSTPGASPSEQYTPAAPDLGNITSTRFYREGDIPVRSGDPAPAVGGQALAYEHEAPLGVMSAWRAAPLYRDGTEGAKSESVALTVSAPSSSRAMWLKPVGDPGLSVLATVVGSVPQFTYAARQTFTAVRGTPYPSASIDGWGAAAGEVTFYVANRADRQRLMECLTSGVVLMQTRPEYDLYDMYVLVGDVTRTRPGAVYQTDTTITVPLTEVARPATVGAPLIIPGRSWADLEAQVATWQQVDGLYPDWYSVAAVPA